jgi:hypothetical protein
MAQRTSPENPERLRARLIIALDALLQVRDRLRESDPAGAEAEIDKALGELLIYEGHSLPGLAQG